jgi:outer membrane receptor for ferrienterochelin and colicins
MYQKVILLFLICATSYLRAQITGRISTSGAEAIPGAVIFWQGAKQGTASDSLGRFTLSWPAQFPDTLVVRSVGFNSQEIGFISATPSFVKITLKSADTIAGVTIVERLSASQFSFFDPIMTEKITQKGLLKAACCNLSESFETNPSVDAAMTDAVSGAKKINLLGLDGIYSQIMFENVPLIRGLSSSYGLAFIPGTWIKSILITKGTGSVVNGYESIAGQLNIDLEKPPEEQQERFFLNAYANHRGRYELNAHYNQKIGSSWGTTLLAHGSIAKQRNDMNDDGFLDMPTYTQINVMNRWNWRYADRMEGQFGIRFLIDDKVSGQFGYKPEQDLNSTFYGIGVYNKQLEFFNKTGFLMSKPGRSIGTIFSARYHDQDLQFGRRTFQGEQRSLYGTALFQDYIKNTNHTFKGGLSYVYDEYVQYYNDTNFSRTEMVPGAFVEYTGHLSTKFTAVIGYRIDHHNLAGLQHTPRLHLKYDVDSNIVIRASGGRGFRYANIFSESTTMFTNSREVKIANDLRAEIAWNYGGSLQYRFKVFKREATLVADYFRTDFINQIVTDLEQPGVISFYNLDGLSFANSYQADVMFEPIERFEVRMAYKYYDVRITYQDKLKQRPLVPQHRAFINLAYALPYDKWTFDFTTRWIGASRMPAHLISRTAQGDVVRTESLTEDFFLFSAHISKKFRKFDVYLGAENIGNFMLHQPIIGADNPFGPVFDASLVYAPTDGRIIYTGIRMKF